MLLSAKVKVLLSPLLSSSSKAFSFKQMLNPSNVLFATCIIKSIKLSLKIVAFLALTKARKLNFTGTTNL